MSSGRITRSHVVKDEEQDENNVKPNVGGNDRRWVMLAPKNLLTAKAENGATTFCKLPHPKNGTLSMFLLNTEHIYEVMKFKEPHRSWLINDSVQKDGSLYMVTPIDSLFLALPYLESAASKGRFTTLDNILVDRHCTSISRLEVHLTTDVLENVCEVKVGEDFTAYKVDGCKVLKWLCDKVRKLSVHLSNSSVNVCNTGQALNFVKSSKEEKDLEDCLRYAWQLISDYIVPSWSMKLKEEFSINEAPKIENVSSPPLKKQKLNVSDAGVEDYRDHKVKAGKKTTMKMTAKQKQLQRVSKGMKSMSSFFKSKP